MLSRRVSDSWRKEADGSCFRPPWLLLWMLYAVTGQTVWREETEIRSRSRSAVSDCGGHWNCAFTCQQKNHRPASNSFGSKHLHHSSLFTLLAMASAAVCSTVPVSRSYKQCYLYTIYQLQSSRGVLVPSQRPGYCKISQCHHARWTRNSDCDKSLLCGRC